MFFVFSIMQYSGNNKAITFGNKKGLGLGGKSDIFEQLKLKDGSDTIETLETDNEMMNNEVDGNNVIFLKFYPQFG